MDEQNWPFWTFSELGASQRQPSFREMKEEGKALEAIKALLAIGDTDFIKESHARTQSFFLDLLSSIKARALE